MADFDHIPQNVIKLRPATNAGGGALVQAKGDFNISALARQHGIRRRTIKRWLDDGWRPDQAVVKVEPQILPSAPPAQGDAHAARTPAHHGGSYVAAGVLALAANVSWASFGLLKATAADIERTWITGRAVMPAFAGLLLSMAVMTWPRRRWSD